MHRTYNYKDFTIEVETEAVAGIAGERVPATPVGYIADVNITKSGSPAATRRLHFGEDAERPFGTPAEALMRGYGVAQQVIDGMKNAVGPNPCPRRVEHVVHFRDVGHRHPASWTRSVDECHRSECGPSLA